MDASSLSVEEGCILATSRSRTRRVSFTLSIRDEHTITRVNRVVRSTEDSFGLGSLFDFVQGDLTNGCTYEEILHAYDPNGKPIQRMSSQLNTCLVRREARAFVLLSVVLR